MDPPRETGPFEKLVETLLNRVLTSGFEPPITVVLVSTSGYVSAVRYRRAAEGGWDGALLVEGKEPKDQFPVNLVFCDSTGRSTVVLINDLRSMPTSIQ